jgi:hypothetical protein
MGARCPFYGFRWPDRTARLIQVGGNECGLDFDASGPCRMEQEGRTVCMHYCDVATRAKPFIDVLMHRIRVYPVDAPNGLGYLEWRDRVLKVKN